MRPFRLRWSRGAWGMPGIQSAAGTGTARQGGMVPVFGPGYRAVSAQPSGASAGTSRAGARAPRSAAGTRCRTGGAHRRRSPHPSTGSAIGKSGRGMIAMNPPLTPWPNAPSASTGNSCPPPAVASDCTSTTDGYPTFPLGASAVALRNCTRPRPVVRAAR